MSFSARIRAILHFVFPLFLFVCSASFAFSADAKTADGKTLWDQGRYRQLGKLAQDRLAHNAADAEALVWLSADYDASGEFDRAVEHARQPTEIAPSSSAAHCQLAD